MKLWFINLPFKQAYRTYFLLMIIIIYTALFSLLAGCSEEVKVEIQEEEEREAEADTAVSKPERAPDYAEIEIEGVLFKLELALTPSQRSIGLMGRQQIDDNGGMLFVFPDNERYPSEVNFYMKNCLVPIDVIFIDGEGIITTIHEMEPPQPGTPDQELIMYPSMGPVQFAIELRGRRAAELGLKPGDYIDLPSDYLLQYAR